jgi:hypothetical protein
LVGISLAPAGATSHAKHPKAVRESIEESVSKLRPGGYVWAPELAPDGPIQIVINLSTQRVMLYRGGVPIAGSTISTGSPGRETPVGVFSILEKQVVHRSKTYDDAPMPFMQRLTWKGVAMHAGHVPGYPASHGCIRLPRKFAKLLYGVTTTGTMVLIKEDPPASEAAADASLETSDKTASKTRNSTDGSGHVQPSPVTACTTCRPW